MKRAGTRRMSMRVSLAGVLVLLWFAPGPGRAADAPVGQERPILRFRIRVITAPSAELLAEAMSVTRRSVERQRSGTASGGLTREKTRAVRDGAHGGAAPSRKQRRVRWRTRSRQPGHHARVGVPGGRLAHPDSRSNGARALGRVRRGTMVRPRVRARAGGHRTTSGSRNGTAAGQQGRRAEGYSPQSLKELLRKGRIGDTQALKRRLQQRAARRSRRRRRSGEAANRQGIVGGAGHGRRRR